MAVCSSQGGSVKRARAGLLPLRAAPAFAGTGLEKFVVDRILEDRQLDAVPWLHHIVHAQSTLLLAVKAGGIPVSGNRDSDVGCPRAGSAHIGGPPPTASEGGEATGCYPRLAECSGMTVTPLGRLGRSQSSGCRQVSPGKRANPRSAVTHTQPCSSASAAR